MYYVERRLHNGETQATDYAKPVAKATLSEAKKEFHNVLATYIGYGKLDKVSVLLYDDDNNIYASEVWNSPVETPESEE